jgi:hypothetical protein
VQGQVTNSSDVAASSKDVAPHSLLEICGAVLGAWEDTTTAEYGLVLKGLSFGETTFKITQKVAAGGGHLGTSGPPVKCLADWVRGTKYKKNKPDVQLAYWTVRTYSSCEIINGALLHVFNRLENMGYKTVRHEGLLFRLASARKRSKYIIPCKQVRTVLPVRQINALAGFLQTALLLYIAKWGVVLVTSPSG